MIERVPPFLLGRKVQGGDSFKSLANIIVDLVLDGRRDIIVSGTPGTGKSVFYLFRLQSKTAIVQSRDLWYRFSDKILRQLYPLHSLITLVTRGVQQELRSPIAWNL